MKHFHCKKASLFAEIVRVLEAADPAA